MAHPKGAPKTPGSGRQKGTQNKKTAQLMEAVKTSGITPLEYMLSILRDPTQNQADRMDAAKAASPYIHPRLANIEQKTEVSGPDGAPLQVEDVSRALENAFDRIKQKRGVPG